MGVGKLRWFSITDRLVAIEAEQDLEVLLSGGGPHAVTSDNPRSAGLR